MISITAKNREDCCGCGACVQACPKQCIRMKTDREGFLYPKVDRESCVDCGRCEAVCPVAEQKKSAAAGAAEPMRAFGGSHKNEDVRERSSSGGAFTLFAADVLSRGGVVFGAAMDPDMTVRHRAVETEEDLEALRGSKYVQSAVGGCYREAKAFLDAGREVLFSGTPCQTAGLLSFLGGPRENLVTVDFICHGVPSPAVFARYIRSLEDESGKKVTGFRFRLKDKGWNPTGLQLGTEITLSDGSRIRRYPAFRDVFMNGFLDDLYLRPICHECPFKKLPHSFSDLTIADFWGVRGVDPELDDGKGTSLVLVHSEQGQRIFDRTKEAFRFRECDPANALRRNPSLTASAGPNPRREAFFRDFRQLPFAQIRKKYLSAWQWAGRKAMKIASGRLKDVLPGKKRPL